MEDNIPIFTKNTASKIIEATIVSETGQKRELPAKADAKELALDLKNAYQSYLGWKNSFENLPTSKQLDAALINAQKKTKKFVKNLDELKNSLEAYESIQPSKTLFATNDIIEETTPNLEILVGYIHTLQESSKSNLLTSGKNPRPETDLVRRLLPDIYSKHFNANIAISRTPEGNPSGPMFRFIRSCLGYMNISLTDEAIASVFKKT